MSGIKGKQQILMEQLRMNSSRKQWSLMVLKGKKGNDYQTQREAAAGTLGKGC
jgi:hypothetical protein